VIFVENALCCILANVDAADVLCAGLDAFARAERTPERRKSS
jgi:hypothetical protein